MDRGMRAVALGAGLLGASLSAAAPEEGAFAVRPLEPQIIVYLQQAGPVTGIPEAVRRLRAWAEERQIAASGPAQAVLYADPAAASARDLFWEVRLPLALDSPAAMPPQPGGLGVMRGERIDAAACAERRDLPGGRGASAGALRQWAAGKGYRVNGPLIEIYIDGLPADASEPVRMQICLPVIVPR